MQREENSIKELSNSRQPPLSHQDMGNFALAILEELGYKVFDDPNNINYRNKVNRSTLIPDLSNEEIAVEVGDLCKPPGSTREARIVTLLKDYKQVFWFPYPRVQKFGNILIPFFHIVIFERTEESVVSTLIKTIADKDKKIEELTRRVSTVVNDLLQDIKSNCERRLDISETYCHV